MTADLTDGLNIDRPLPRLGAEFVWQKSAFVRGGYVFDSAESDAGGPTLGLGFSRNNLVLDLAQSVHRLLGGRRAGTDVSLAAFLLLSRRHSRDSRWSCTVVGHSLKLERSGGLTTNASVRSTGRWCWRFMMSVRVLRIRSWSPDEHTPHPMYEIIVSYPIEMK